MNKFEELKNLISINNDIVDFAEFGNGVSEEWISKAEERLSFDFPNSYRWWLKNYGGGEIYGEEIYSIYEQDFDTVVGGDIVYMYELNVKNKNYNELIIVICEADDDVYYYDKTIDRADSEIPIYSYNTSTIYAKDFIEFLKRRITGD